MLYAFIRSRVMRQHDAPSFGGFVSSGTSSIADRLLVTRLIAGRGASFGLRLLRWPLRLVSQLEVAKAGQFDTAAAFEGGADFLEKGLDHARGAVRYRCR